MLPYKPQRLRVGATYKWTNLNIETTTEARQELENKINKLFKPSYQVVAQKAGIRPATKDRRPIVGVHKDYPNVAILNGLGSKGASISPYLAYILTELLEGNDAPYLCLANEINPYRFVK
jgi:glycine/D-amino acid oxidase-like deaminating enzyme